MNIRTRLTVIFFALFAVLLSIILGAIYYFSADYRKEDFYRRLKNRAINTAMVLTDIKEVNADLLRRMEHNNPASLPGQYILIYNEKNEMAYHSQGLPVVNVDTALLNRVRRENEIAYHGDKFEVLGFMVNNRHHSFAVIAAATDVYGLDALQNLRHVIIITFFISMLIVIVLAWFFAGRVLRPISAIVKQVGNITELNLNRRLDEGNKRDELSKLAQTFNHMLERLQRAFVAQKHFIANASHEIKTPITVMSAEVEVSLLSPRDEAYYIRVLRSVLNGLRGLNGLSSRLLMLAQASSDEPELNFDVIRIDDVLWEMKAELLKAFPEYVVDINFGMNLNADHLALDGDEQLMRVAMLNLMDNGCKYSDANTVHIYLESNTTQRLTITFKNTGKGIGPDYIDRIFEPFYRAKNATLIKGSGIGLSLVHRIIQLHGGNVSVTSVPGHTTEFIVELTVHKEDR